MIKAKKQKFLASTVSNRSCLICFGFVVVVVVVFVFVFFRFYHSHLAVNYLTFEFV